MPDNFSDRHCPTEGCPMYLRHKYNEDTSLHCTWCGYKEPAPTPPDPSKHHTCPKPYCYACRVRERDEARDVAITLFRTINHFTSAILRAVPTDILDKHPWLGGSG